MAKISRISKEFIFPQPDAEGIAAVQKLYRDKLEREITTTEAHEVLSRVMRWLWLINFPPPESDEQLLKELGKAQGGQDVTLPAS